MPSPLSAHVNNPGVKPPSIDCRVYERQACEIPTTCHPATIDGNEVRWQGTICDISQGGVRIVLVRRFEKGTGLALELPGDGEREPSVVFVRVVHLRQQEDGRWALGCKFVSDLSGEEVQRLTTSKQYVLSSLFDEDSMDEPDKA